MIPPNRPYQQNLHNYDKWFRNAFKKQQICVNITSVSKHNTNIESVHVNDIQEKNSRYTSINEVM